MARNCCIEGLPALGNNNINEAPLFQNIISNDYVVLAGSPTIDEGTNTCTLPTDLQGNLRVVNDKVDIGCYELGTNFSCSFTMSDVPDYLTNKTIVFMAYAYPTNAQIAWYDWDLDGDSNYEISGPDKKIITNAVVFNAPLTISVRIRTMAGESAPYSRYFPILFVSAQSANPLYPYSSWETASRTITNALAAAYNTPASLVIVTNGLYMESNIWIQSSTRLKSVNGPQYTAIYGSHGWTGIRMYHGSPADPWNEINGFTVRDYYNNSDGGIYADGWARILNCVVSNCYGVNAGGVYGNAHCIVSNCVVMNCGGDAQTGNGGGICMRGGRLYNSTIVNCLAKDRGAGAYLLYSNVTRNCNIYGNSCWGCSSGGGIYADYNTLVENCSISNNTIWPSNPTFEQRGGGGIYLNNGSICRNSAIADNFVTRASLGGGGVFVNGGSLLENCLIYGNKAYVCESASWPDYYQKYPRSGAGVMMMGTSTVRNCTVAFNEVVNTNLMTLGAGIWMNDGLVENCIGYMNTASNDPDIYSSKGIVQYCRASTIPQAERGNIDSDPCFVNADTNVSPLNFRLKSVMGTYDDTTGMWIPYAQHSPCIDAGNPASDYLKEPLPNGGHINMGWDGNNPYASKSSMNAWLLAVTYNDGGDMSGTTNRLSWTSGGFGSLDTVRLEYSTDPARQEWHILASGISITNGYWIWDVSGLDPMDVHWRVVSMADTNIWDANDRWTSVNGGLSTFYVNDGSTNGDMYCMAVGNDTNSGVLPAAPVTSLAAILIKYIVNSGDTIYVDTGCYSMSNRTITMTSENQGAVGNPIVIQGSTNVVAGGTILDRQGTGGQILTIDHANYIRFHDLTVRGAQDGIRLSNTSGIEFERVQSVSNTQYGFYLTDSSCAGMLHCVAAYNAYGLRVNGNNVSWEGGVLWGNGVGIQAEQSSFVTISNSVIGQSSGQAYANSLQNIRGDYNVFDLTGTATLGGSENSKLSDYQQTYNREWHSAVMSVDFADPAGLDFHPKSSAGRYLPGVGWMNDAIDSQLIDMGAPEAAYANEPAPNGGRLNIGLYGNTPEASKSRTNAWLRVLTFNDGGTLSEPQSVYWIAQHFTSGATVRVDYSTNNGVTWVVLAQAIPANVGRYGLEPFAYGSGTGIYWRVVSESDTNVLDQNDLAFRYVNGGSLYYVNDNSRMGDVFTTAIGSDTNSGCTNSAPKATLENLLNACKLKGGDVVYIDTGIYRITNDVVWTTNDSGYDAIHLRIQGSTNEVWPTSIAGGGLVLQDVKAVDINNLNIQNANTGLKLNQSSNCMITWVQCHGHAAHGFVVTNSANCFFRHCVSMNNAQAGLLNAASVGTRWESGVMWSNRQQGVRLEGGGLTVRNSAIASLNTNAVCYYRGSGSLTADFNSIYVTNGAAVGYLASNGKTYTSLPDWVQATGCDSNSLSGNPGFVDPVAGDFHEKSSMTMGRYLRGYGWTNDVETSVLIDAGDPNEWDPNGSRINIGLYGNTSESSRRQ